VPIDTTAVLRTGQPVTTTPGASAAGPGKTTRPPTASRPRLLSALRHPALPAWLFLLLPLTAAGLTATTGCGTVVAWLSGIIAPVAILIGIRWHRPADTTAWWLMFTGGTVVSLSQLLPDGGPPGGHLVYELRDNALTMPGLLLLTIGQIRIARLRGLFATISDRVDAVMLGLAGLLMSWVFVLGPELRGTDRMTAAEVYPALGVPLGVVSVLMLAHRTRMTPALGFFTAGAGGVFLTSAVLMHVGPWFTDHGRMMAYTAIIGALGAAALHPSMADLTLPVPARPVRSSLWRSARLALPLLMAFIGLLAQIHLHEDDSVFVAIVASALALIVTWRMVNAVNRHAEMEHVLRHQATHDPLTGLPNRELLNRVLDDVLDNPCRTAGIGVLFLDLDRFKTVNDTWGHRTGDELLVEAARRMQATVRSGGPRVR
jgi:hypothetical protein